jgi:hypothetical protein
MEMYNSCVTGDIKDLTNIISKKYSLVEEVSQAGHFWTMLHYASHYGKTL